MTKGRNDDAQARDRAAAWIAAAGVLSALTAGAASAAETAVGLTNANPSTLVTFPVGNPGAATPATRSTSRMSTGAFSGPDTNLIGLDHRPRGGALYAQATRGTLYVLTQAAAAGQFNATAVNVTPFVSPFFSNFLNDFGFGFNPVADAIRVVEEGALNFRFSPNNGNSLARDESLENPGDPRIVAADYTNSFDGTTSTTLYDIDSGSDRLFTQGSVGGAPVSPNTGTLIDVGALGVDTTDNAGLDIAQASGTAYASFELAGSPGSSTLHRLNLSMGAATPVGTIAGGMPLESLSVVPASVLQFPSSATAVRKSSGQVQIPVTRTGPGAPHGHRGVLPLHGQRRDADVRARRLPGEHHGADDRQRHDHAERRERERGPRAAVIDQRGRGGRHRAAAAA